MLALWKNGQNSLFPNENRVAFFWQLYKTNGTIFDKVSAWYYFFSGQIIQRLGLLANNV